MNESKASPLLTTGLSGLVGSTFRDAYSEQYDFLNLDLSDSVQPVDITSYSDVARAVSSSPAKAIIHLAAFTDVTAAWNQTGDTSGSAYKVNVLGTQNIAKAAKEFGKHLIHISTAFVFDGTKEGLYTEEDSMNPIEWYGHTKAKAEEMVIEECNPNAWTILRIDFPFRSLPSLRPDIVRKNIEGLQKGYPLFEDHFFGPTYLDDFAKVLDWVVQTAASVDSSGLLHASSGERWSDFQLAQTLIDLHNLPYEAKSGKLVEYLKTTQRPYQKNTAMDVSKLRSVLPFSLSSIEEALKSVQIDHLSKKSA